MPPVVSLERSPRCCRSSCAVAIFPECSLPIVADVNLVQYDVAESPHPVGWMAGSTGPRAQPVRASTTPGGSRPVTQAFDAATTSAPPCPGRPGPPGRPPRTPWRRPRRPDRGTSSGSAPGPGPAARRLPVLRQIVRLPARARDPGVRGRDRHGDRHRRGPGHPLALVPLAPQLAHPQGAAGVHGPLRLAAGRRPAPVPARRRPRLLDLVLRRLRLPGRGRRRREPTFVPRLLRWYRRVLPWYFLGADRGRP